MKYEKPKWEHVVLETDDIIRTSLGSSTAGEGGGWTDQAP